MTSLPPQTAAMYPIIVPRFWSATRIGCGGTFDPGHQTAPSHEERQKPLPTGSRSQASTVRRSVCMATYNGAEFVEAQIASILDELDARDEVVIVDDGSSDDTPELVRGFQDERIRVEANTTRLGHVRTFERAIELSRGDIVFLADQDDIWVPGRVKKMEDALIASGADAVVGGYQCFTEDCGTIEVRDPVVVSKTSAPSAWGRLFLGRQPYFGSAMAFRRDAVSRLLPFPRFIEAHDHWVATVALAGDGLEALDQVVVMRRLHRRNLTPTRRRSTAQVLKTRALMFRMAAVGLVRQAQRNSDGRVPR